MFNLMDRITDPLLPPLIIVEVADAHYGDLNLAKAYIRKASELNFEVIKFQHHIPDEEMLPDIPISKNMKEPLYDFLKKNALTIDQHKELEDYATKLNINYLCTPFSLAAAKELNDNLNIWAFKIGSGEFLDHPTIIELMKFNKPLILSTGMSTESEVDETYEIIKIHKPGIVFMNCTSAYPPSFEDIHLKFIQKMISKYSGVVVGHSDHMPNKLTSIAAFCLGARVIEKHVTIDPNLIGPDSEVSLDFDALFDLKTDLENLHKSMNSDKVIHDSEFEIREWAHRSLVYLRSMNEGELITQNDVWSKRPGTGIPARYMSQFVGRELKRNVHNNTLVEENDFK
jgi:N,N'-diacetyllegionaminate synthase